jgi:hypothetical protein
VIAVETVLLAAVIAAVIAAAVAETVAPTVAVAVSAVVVAAMPQPVAKVKPQASLWKSARSIGPRS